MAREVAPTNQWPDKKGVGARWQLGKLIDHPDFPGFVTISDAGTPVAYMIADPNHAGFVTPDTAATEGDASVLIVGGGFAVVAGS